MVFAVTLKDGGALIGDMVLLFRDREAGQGEIGFSINPVHAGRGYATEAAVAVINLGFGHFNLHRIYGRWDARNEPSLAADAAARHAPGRRIFRETCDLQGRVGR